LDFTLADTDRRIYKIGVGRDLLRWSAALASNLVGILFLDQPAGPDDVAGERVGSINDRDRNADRGRLDVEFF
jgi:hypothetical protein